jgi:hypothetical protein
MNSVHNALKEFLEKNTGYLVGCVVDKYINTSGFLPLTPQVRRRVAALVFHILEESRANATRKAMRGHAETWYKPEFEGAERTYRDCISECISFNANYKNNGRTELCEGQKLSVSLSPALDIVLYSLLGAPGTLLATLRMHELATALYIFRVKVQECVQEFYSQWQEGIKSEDTLWAVLDERLSDLQLVQ